MSKTIKISSVEGNYQKLDGGAMFGNVPRPLWEKWAPPDEKSRISLSCRAMLIECEQGNILCEAGIGAFFDPTLSERFGVYPPKRHLLLENLSKLGFHDRDIDYVILSHLHFDHAGGILPTYEEIQNGNRELLFPKAQFIVGKEAYERALHPHYRDRASFISDLPEKLQRTGRLVLIDPKEPLSQNLGGRLSFRYSSGHTPGQMHTLFRGEHTSVLYCGDLIPGVAWIHLPVTMGYDRYPELLIDEKQALYREVVEKDWILFFTHDPKHCSSKVKIDDKGKYSADKPQTELIQFEL